MATLLFVLKSIQANNKETISCIIGPLCAWILLMIVGFCAERSVMWKVCSCHDVIICVNGIIITERMSCYQVFTMQRNSTLSKSILNTLRLKQNGRHFANNIFKCISLDENVWILIKISLKFILKGPNNNIDITALVQIMAWCWQGDKPFSEPMMVSLLMRICVSQLQWVIIIEKPKYNSIQLKSINLGVKFQWPNHRFSWQIDWDLMILTEIWAYDSLVKILQDDGARLQ